MSSLHRAKAIKEHYMCCILMSRWRSIEHRLASQNLSIHPPASTSDETICLHLWLVEYAGQSHSMEKL